MLEALVGAADAALETRIRSVVISSYDLNIPSVNSNIQSGLKDVGVNSWSLEPARARRTEHCLASCDCKQGKLL
jgi:hypothetical protein